MHHSSKPPDASMLRELYGKGALQVLRRDQIGPTGKFPVGKLAPSDEGELAFTLGYTEGKVVLHFNTQVEWIGFTPEQAIDLANGLKKHARKAQGL